MKKWKIKGKKMKKQLILILMIFCTSFAGLRGAEEQQQKPIIDLITIQGVVVPCIGSYLEPLIPHRDKNFAVITRAFKDNEVQVIIRKNHTEYIIQESYQELDYKNSADDTFTTALRLLHDINNTYEACIVLTNTPFEILESALDSYNKTISNVKKEQVLQNFDSIASMPSITIGKITSAQLAEAAWLECLTSNTLGQLKKIIVIDAEPSLENNLQKHTIAMEKKAKETQPQIFVGSNERKIFIGQCVGLAVAIIASIALLCAWLHKQGVPLY